MSLLYFTSPKTGTFEYNPLSGTVLNVGMQQTLNTAFTPTDNVNYTTASASVFINVLNTTQVTPTTTWNKPADITYGTALSSNQLNATSPKSGSFTYNPPPGTVLSAGQNHQLTTIFTPTDTANYTTASATALINVRTPTQKINQMITFVQGITTPSELDEGSSYELTAMLQASEKSIDEMESEPTGGMLALIANLILLLVR